MNDRWAFCLRIEAQRRGIGSMRTLPLELSLRPMQLRQPTCSTTVEILPFEATIGCTRAGIGPHVDA